MPNMKYMILYIKSGHAYIYKYDREDYARLIEILNRQVDDDQLNMEQDDTLLIIKQADDLKKLDTRFGLI